MMRIRERGLATFVPWGPAEFNLSIGKNSLLTERTSNVNGLLLANHTSVAGVILLSMSAID
jgi:tubulin gamma